MATTASITIDQSSGAAPLPVFVHARGSTLDYQDAGQAYYLWNFGDPSGDHNIIHGAGCYNAAHVYETAGSYTITLTVYERDGLGSEYSSQTTQAVTVSAFSGTTYYVDATGGDNGNGGTSESDAWETYEYAIGQLSGANERLLFRCGETFDTANGALVASSGTSASPVIIGQYGTGDDPVINHTGSSGTALELTDAASSVRVQDVSFEGAGGDYGIEAGLTDDVLYLRTTLSGFDTNLKHGSTTAMTNSGLYLFDCDSDDSDGGQVVLSGLCVAVVGCTFDDDASTHCLAIANASGLICADTTVSGPSDEVNSDASAVWLYNEASSLGAQVGQETGYCVFLDCTITGGRVPFRAVPQIRGYAEVVDDVVVERCELQHTPDDHLCQTDTMVAVSGSRVYVRNCEMHGPVGSANGTGELTGVRIEDHSAAGLNAPGTVEVKANTLWGGGCVICETDVVYFVEVELENATDLVIEDNIAHVTYSQGDNTALLKLAGPWIQDEIVERYNYLYCNSSTYSYICRDFVGLTLTQWQAYGKGTGSSSGTDPVLADPDDEDFTLDSTSPCLGTGLVTDGVWTDHAGNLRSPTSIDIGAHDTTALLRAAMVGSGALSAFGSSNYVRASASGTGALTAALTGDGAVSVAIAGTGALTGALNQQAPVSISVAGTGSMTATLTGDGEVAAAIAGTGALDVDVRNVGYMVVAIAAGVIEEGDVSFVCSVLGDAEVAAAIAGTGAFRCNLTGPIEISGSSAGTGALSATATGDGAVSIAMAGTSTMTPHVTVKNQSMWATISGTGALTGTLTADGALAGTSAGTGALVATVTADGAISVTMAGTSTLIAYFEPYEIVEVTLGVETAFEFDLEAETGIAVTLTHGPVPIAAA